MHLWHCFPPSNADCHTSAVSRLYPHPVTGINCSILPLLLREKCFCLSSSRSCSECTVLSDTQGYSLFWSLLLYLGRWGEVARLPRCPNTHPALFSYLAVITTRQPWLHLYPFSPPQPLGLTAKCTDHSGRNAYAYFISLLL